MLIEVHLGGEETKSGVAEKDLPALAENIAALSHLELRGLMTIPPFLDEPERVRPYFRKLGELCGDASRRLGRALPVISMGMSHDFEAAIEEGSEWCRSRPSVRPVQGRRQSVIEIAEGEGGVAFAVRVTPLASRNTIEGEHAGALKVRLTAPPVEDRANEALRRLLATSV